MLDLNCKQFSIQVYLMSAWPSLTLSMCTCAVTTRQSSWICVQILKNVFCILHAHCKFWQWPPVCCLFAVNCSTSFLSVLNQPAVCEGAQDIKAVFSHTAPNAQVTTYSAALNPGGGGVICTTNNIGKCQWTTPGIQSDEILLCKEQSDSTTNWSWQWVLIMQQQVGVAVCASAEPLTICTLASPATCVQLLCVL
jgi:hypothetical protein